MDIQVEPTIFEVIKAEAYRRFIDYTVSVAYWNHVQLSNTQGVNWTSTTGQHITGILRDIELGVLVIDYHTDGIYELKRIPFRYLRSIAIWKSE